MKRTTYPLCVIAFVAVSATARAADPLDLYIGGSFGGANVRSTYPPLTFAGTDVGWKAFVGVRPISFASIEVAYINFGHATAPLPPPNFAVIYLGDNSRQQAVTVFGVGYLPLPIPFLDLYGKVGIAKLNTRQQVEGGSDALPGLFDVTQNRWTTDFAYGAGVQAKFGQFALRAEYEQINASGGNPALSSIGFLWTF